MEQKYLLVFFVILTKTFSECISKGFREKDLGFRPGIEVCPFLTVFLRSSICVITFRSTYVPLFIFLTVLLIMYPSARLYKKTVLIGVRTGQ